MSWAFALGIGFLVTAVGTWLLATHRLALGRARIAQPRADRWHARPTPSMGGAAIFVGFAAGLVATDGLASTNLKLLAAAFLLFLLGFVDDVRNVPPVGKLAVQALAATVLVASDIGVTVAGPAIVAVPATIGLLVLASNALNILDNMDGITAGVTMAASGTLLLWTTLADGLLPAAIAAAVLGAAAGFAIFNVHPARIFMGDSGSLWLGMVLAAMAMIEAGPADTWMARLMIPAVLLAVPLADTAVVVVARASGGRPILAGGTDHTAHRLVAMGLGQRAVAITLLTVAVACGAAASALRFLDAPLGMAAAAGLTLALGVGAVVVLRVDPARGGLAAEGTARDERR